jgi:hypothetical protein
MFKFKLLSVLFLATAVLAQDYDEYRPAVRPSKFNSVSEENKPTPIPILKQINRHNEDGSYTYGYEGADGSFKIETKLATGEVKGKYGYVDESGKVRVVEYGANKYGFQPSGEGITVAPPTYVDETTGKDQIDYEDEPPRYAPKPKAQAPRPYKPAPAPKPQKSYFEDLPVEPQYYDYEQEAQQVRPAPTPAPAPIRPKYTQVKLPAQQQQQPQPQPQQPQYQNTIDIVYSQSPRQQAPARQSFFDDRQPQTFPAIDTQSAPAAPRIPAQPTQIFSPAPQRSAPAPKQQFQYQPAPIPQSRPAPVYQSQGGRSTSVLDELQKDFALPNSAPALHDISFGYNFQ